MKILDANAAVPRNEKGRGDSSMEFEKNTRAKKKLWKPKRKIDHFAALGACHFQFAELELKLLKYKDRVSVRGGHFTWTICIFLLQKARLRPR